LSLQGFLGFSEMIDYEAPDASVVSEEFDDVLGEFDELIVEESGHDQGEHKRHSA
jgi:hypothetical protein